jgi:hypothetical protein
MTRPLITVTVNVLIIFFRYGTCDEADERKSQAIHDLIY